MAYFAEINEFNKVTRVLSIPNEQEHKGQEYLAEELGLGGTWIKTSYNTKAGIHFDSETGEPSDDQSKALRKNFAGQGFIYDEVRDAFYEPSPFVSWVLNEDSCVWEAPIPYPNDGKKYIWNDNKIEWEEVD